MTTEAGSVRLRTSSASSWTGTRPSPSSVLDDGYMLMLVQPMPAAVPREVWLGLLPDYVADEYLVEEQTVDVDGDTAAVLSRVRMRADVLGEDRSGTFVLTDVMRHRSGGWRVWRRHLRPRRPPGDCPPATERLAAWLR